MEINRMKSFSASQDAISYSTRITPGKAIDGPVIGKVVASGNNKFVKDDLVLGVFTWAEYCFVKETTIMRKLEPSEFPLTYHLGVLAKEKERVCIGKLRWKGRGKKGCDGERGERGCARSGEGCNGEGDGGAVYARKVGIKFGVWFAKSSKYGGHVSIVYLSKMLALYICRRFVPTNLGTRLLNFKIF
ncbi:uncharacterized protein LOC107618007 isoform X3 [Arachis ipaensis]|uniref:uncharacterized protein LOC107618007 isoform X3 n=1 Tax=Arachis ipaensis TaxID=130454 RepID=UPI000A2B8EFF|nr:uncharacterized protein LOC107618007 isoform X3 [Arachis ipaensis]